ncbi:hypothetical protein BRADI_3g33724v3 [Brachypodium distachyon]|uniref:Uncharacterized protein n=1 Tax=Brachypodium distachyon TaxID=15368 RepID=A0A2K2D0X1_BRADI|nr:hypothetical protein BRADI_3g33724v3 [Brachypodium distachyon]
MSRRLSSQCCSLATTSKKARRSEASGVSSSSSSSSYDCAYMPSESFARFSLPKKTVVVPSELPQPQETWKPNLLVGRQLQTQWPMRLNKRRQKPWKTPL